MSFWAGEGSRHMEGISYITRNVFATEPDAFRSRGGGSCGRGEERKGEGLDWSVAVAANRRLGGSSPRQCRSQDNLSPLDHPEIRGCQGLCSAVSALWITVCSRWIHTRA